MASESSCSGVICQFILLLCFKDRKSTFYPSKLQFYRHLQKVFYQMHKKILQKQNKSRTKAEQTENRATVTTTRGEKGATLTTTQEKNYNKINGLRKIRATLTTTRDFYPHPYYYICLFSGIIIRS